MQQCMDATYLCLRREGSNMTVASTLLQDKRLSGQRQPATLSE